MIAAAALIDKLSHIITLFPVSVILLLLLALLSIYDTYSITCLSVVDCSSLSVHVF